MQIDRDDASAGQINSIDSFDPFFLVASFLCNLNSSHQRSGQPKSASAILHDLLLCDTSRFGGRRCRFAINLCRQVLLNFRQFLIKYTGHQFGSVLDRLAIVVGKAIGASVFLFRDLSYRKNAEIQFAGQLH